VQRLDAVPGEEDHDEIHAGHGHKGSWSNLLLAIRTYEAHGRIALEQEDVTEYNQCQTQLLRLYQRVRYATIDMGHPTWKAALEALTNDPSFSHHTQWVSNQSSSP